MDSKRLFPIGIIINELLTNSLKYAFTGKDSGIIQVIFRKKHGNITLILHDNGNGFPAF